jgi:D-aminopeptidase
MKVADLTVEELRALIKEAVQEELRGVLADPDEGLELSAEIEERLRASLASSARMPLVEAKKRLDLS